MRRPFPFSSCAIDHDVRIAAWLGVIAPAAELSRPELIDRSEKSAELARVRVRELIHRP